MEQSSACVHTSEEKVENAEEPNVSRKIDRVSGMSKEIVDEYVCKSQPFIITDYVPQWKAYTLYVLHVKKTLLSHLIIHIHLRWRDPKYLLEKIGPDTLLPRKLEFIISI
jgi:hypothetical protein